jgi:hypothetical protein
VVQPFDVRCAVEILSRNPGRKQGEGVGGRGARFRGVDREGESGFGDHVEAFVGEGEVADDLVMELLGARTM